MPPRRLSPEERAAWLQLARSVRPFRATPTPIQDEDTLTRKGQDLTPKVERSLTNAAPAKIPAVSRPVPAEILDSSWERRIQKGQLHPEMAIDLHGHSLSLAHQRMERALAEAVMRDVRVLLVIAGKARESTVPGERPGRGAIRAEIGHWLENSPFSHRIASVRNAHPRHGGAGALYVIMRRKK